MRLLLLQTDIRWGAPQANRIHAQKLIDAAPAADLIVLPEMFTTGFCTSPKGLAEKSNTETLLWMQDLAKKKNAAIAGGIAIEEEGLYYNRLYFVKPDGSHTAYDKRHLFTFAGEDKEYTAGNNRIIVDHCKFRILLQICYDIRFPVFARNKGDYDMIIYIANWPTVRIHAWNTLLMARAIENQCYVVGVNRTGNDPTLQYNGGTALIDYLGKPIVAAEDGKEEAIYGIIDINALNEFRKKFPALQDADSFRIC